MIARRRLVRQGPGPAGSWVWTGRVLRLNQCRSRQGAVGMYMYMYIKLRTTETACFDADL
jgi:hypothetical protein